MADNSDNSSISVDDLLAAIGVPVPPELSGKREESSSKDSKDGKESQEEEIDLLAALGIRSPAPEPKTQYVVPAASTSQEPSVADGAHPSQGAFQQAQFQTVGSGQLARADNVVKQAFPSGEGSLQPHYDQNFSTNATALDAQSQSADQQSEQSAQMQGQPQGGFVRAAFPQQPFQQGGISPIGQQATPDQQSATGSQPQYAGQMPQRQGQAQGQVVVEQRPFSQSGQFGQLQSIDSDHVQQNAGQDMQAQPGQSPQPLQQQPTGASQQQQTMQGGFPQPGGAFPSGVPQGMPYNVRQGGQAAQHQPPMPYPQQAFSQDANGFGGAAPRYQQQFQPDPVPYQGLDQKSAIPREKKSKRSNSGTVLGAILIVIAIVCATAAVGLITGIFDIQPSTPVRQVEPSSSSNGNMADAQSSNSESTSQTTEAIYTYIVRGTDGSAHEATETATFNSDGKLTQSKIDILVEDDQVAAALLAQLEDEFGDAVIASSAENANVTIVLSINRDDLTKDAYTELLRSEMTEFKEVG